MLHIAERKLSIPAKWTPVDVPKAITKNYRGHHVMAPAHKLYTSALPVAWEDGSPVLMPYHKVPRFIRDYNASNNLEGEDALKFISLRDDNEVRKKLDVNKISSNVWMNYLTRPNRALRPVPGIRQQLACRVLYMYGADGELHEICPVTIAPSGMVPALNKERLERIVHADGLKTLGTLRGRDIYENDNEVVDVMDIFGNPQITFDHDARDEIGLIPHSYHVYT